MKGPAGKYQSGPFSCFQVRAASYGWFVRTGKSNSGSNVFGASWLYGVVIGTLFMSYLVIACYNNPSILQFGYPKWMETKDVWKIIGCNMLFVCSVAMVVTGMSDRVGNIPKIYAYSFRLHFYTYLRLSDPSYIPQ